MAVRGLLIDVRPLRVSPQFLRLWLGRAMSSFGTQMTAVAVLFQVWQLTHSTVWTGAIGMAQAVPLIGFGLFAGSIIDSGDRRRIYLFATIGQAVCSVLLAVQAIWVHVPAAGILGLIAAQGLFTTGTGPAARSFIPRLLPADQVGAGMALNRIAFQSALLIGPALGGLLIGWLGVQGCYIVDAITFAFSFYGAFGLPAVRAEAAQAGPGLRGMLEGLGFLLRNRAVRGALLTDLAATVLSFPISLFPLINAQRFHNDPRTLGLFLAAIAGGGVIASILSGAFTRAGRPGAVMLAGAATWGLALALFGLMANPWVGLLLLAVAGAADTVSVVSRSTIVQLHTPDDLRGRVGAAEQIVGLAGPGLGNMRAGLVARAASGVASLVSGGLLCLVGVAAIGASTPELRQVAVAS